MNIKAIELTIIGFLLLSGLSVSLAKEASADVAVDKTNLHNIVKTLSVDIGPRNTKHYESLQLASDYIRTTLSSYGYAVERQTFNADGKTYENLIASIGPDGSPMLVIGAHYDSFGDQPGADDNASGVAGLIELARLFKEGHHDLKNQVVFVAYTLEEPPYFRTPSMGSYVHAKSLHDNGSEVLGMAALEMIGYFSDEKDSQNYPVAAMKLLYPSTGSFIGVVSNFSSSELGRTFSKSMERAEVDVSLLSAPGSVAGVDFSDQMNYWAFDYDAVMVTDTAFYRNSHYHKQSDTIETLDFDKMSEVVKGVYFAAMDIAKKERAVIKNKKLIKSLKSN